jgi:hypothetical protein
LGWATLAPRFHNWGNNGQTPRKTPVEQEAVELPALEIAEMKLADGQWCVVSADPAKPLTEEQARAVALGYQAIAQILAGNP